MHSLREELSVLRIVERDVGSATIQRTRFCFHDNGMDVCYFVDCDVLVDIVDVKRQQLIKNTY